MKKAIGALCILMLVSILPMAAGSVNNQEYNIQTNGTSDTDWWPTPIVVNDKIYISLAYSHAPGGGSLYCVDAQDGNMLWSKSFGIGDLSCSVFGDGRVYVAGMDQNLKAAIWCFDSETGTEIWAFSWLGSALAAALTPMYYDGQLYFIWVDIRYVGPNEFEGTYHIRCVKDWGDFALTKWDQEIAFIDLTNPDRYLGDLTPAIYNGEVYAITDHTVYGFNADTGVKDLEAQRPKKSDLSLAVVDGKIYYGEQGYVTCLNANNGNEIWSTQLDSNPRIVLSPNVADGKVYAGLIKNGDSSYVYCLDDSNNGNILWSKHLFDTTSKRTYLSPATIADGKVYIGGGVSSTSSPWGKVYCLDSNNGNELWNHSIDAAVYASPAVANGALYVVSYISTLYKFEDEYQNHAPDPPVIDGETNGEVGTEYSYTFVSVDQDGDDISRYTVNWGDNSGDTITGPFTSGQIITVNHTWSEKGTYTVSAKATDVNDAESDWGTLSVTMPLDLPGSQQSNPQSNPNPTQQSTQPSSQPISKTTTQTTIGSTTLLSKTTTK
ncbi:MAG: PQQ-binding-like beta-propeller repeat protein [Euryarchaeota archaeon]|nr:PQQ-binding-like beta-propeller repeat protein [Euryarchaeota archaeon]